MEGQLEILKPDTYIVDRFSCKTARYLQTSIGNALNKLYLKSQKEKLSERDFAEAMASISEDMYVKLRELGEVNTFGVAVSKIRQVLAV